MFLNIVKLQFLPEHALFARNAFRKDQRNCVFPSAKGSNPIIKTAAIGQWQMILIETFIGFLIRFRLEWTEIEFKVTQVTSGKTNYHVDGRACFISVSNNNNF